MKLMILETRENKNVRVNEKHEELIEICRLIQALAI